MISKLYKFDRLQLDGESVLIGGHDNGKNVCPMSNWGRGISTVLSVTQIIQYKHYEILQQD